MGSETFVHYLAAAENQNEEVQRQNSSSSDRRQEQVQDQEEIEQVENCCKVAMTVCGEEIAEMKWTVLAIACFLMFGGEYVYNFPSALGSGPVATVEALFLSHGKEYTSEMNQALYSVYSWPNTVAATFGGILIDNYLGLRKSLMLFTSLVTLGTFLVWVGVFSINYPLMLIGRFIFGLGNESLSVAQYAFVTRFFRGKKRGIALAFGIIISSYRVGSSLNFLFSPQIAEKINVEFATLVGALLCALSTLAAVALCFVDVYAEKKNIVAPEEIKVKERKSTSLLADFRKIELRAWFVFIICATIYSCIFPWVGIGANFFEVKYHITQSQGSTYVSIYQFACAGFSPFTGALVDHSGRAVIWMIVAGAGFTIVHFTFIIAKPNPIAISIFMGLIYSLLASSLWPAVPFVVAPSEVGFAYGLMNSVQNTLLAIFPLIVGAILDSQTPPPTNPVGICANWTNDGFNASKIPSVFPYNSLVNCTNSTSAALPYLRGYEDSVWLFMFTAFIGCLLSVWLMFIDLGRDRILTASAGERKRIFGEKILTWKKENERLLAAASRSSSSYVYSRTMSEADIITSWK
jgi:MFS family permease